MTTKIPTHSELIQRLCCDLQNSAYWAEFARRFHDYICFVVVRELTLQVGQANPDAIAQFIQEVYARLLACSGQALRDYRGREENSLYRYLEIIAIRTVLKGVGSRA